MAAAHPGTADVSANEEKKSETVITSPSFTPGKAVASFRVYDPRADGWGSTVLNHYTMMRKNQTVEFADRMAAKWHSFSHAHMGVWEAFEMLKGFVDASDPDTTLPNLVHMLQTAERARAAGEPDWFQLICLIHDLGKIMCMLGGAEEDGQGNSVAAPQYAVGGDTWVVGCRIPDVTVFPELNTLNPDMKHPVYSTENGIYTPGCGMMALKYAYGHDEYMYQMVKFNKCAFPEEGLAILRLHSCYPWHRGGAYRQFMKPGDEKLLEAVLRFNQYDLYSKSDSAPDPVALKPYYQSLIDKYMPGKLHW